MTRRKVRVRRASTEPAPEEEQKQDVEETPTGRSRTPRAFGEDGTAPVSRRSRRSRPDPEAGEKLEQIEKEIAESRVNQEDTTDEEAPAQLVRRSRRVRRSMAEPVEEKPASPEVKQEELSPAEKLEEVVAEGVEEEPPTRKRRVSRSRPSAKPAAEEKPPVEEPVTEPEQELEEPEPAQPTRRRTRRSALPKPEPTPEAKPFPDEPDEPQEPEEDEDWDEEAESEEASLPVQATENEISNAILAVLAVGKSINIMKIGTRYVISEGQEMTQVSKRSTYAMTKDEMEAIAMTAEYVEFSKWWPKLTWEEKVAEAEKKKVSWDRHDDAQVDNIRCTVAMRKKMGVRKWKAPYKTRRAKEDLWKKGIRAD